MIEPIAEFYRRGFEIVVIGLDGSPSSGVRYAGKAKDWGGRPHVEEGDYEVVGGIGVWIEELKRCLELRNVPWPRASGMLLDRTDWFETRDLPATLRELDQFLRWGSSCCTLIRGATRSRRWPTESPMTAQRRSMYLRSSAQPASGSSSSRRPTSRSAPFQASSTISSTIGRAATEWSLSATRASFDRTVRALRRQ